MNFNAIEEKRSLCKTEEKKLPGFLLLIFRFLASVRLAIPLLLLLMIALAAGTLLESAYNADTAKLLIYDSLWFSILLFLIAINVAFAAFDRFPWQKRHVGFVITHVGILLVLAGSFVTQRMMVDAQMAISEGDTEQFILLSDPILYLSQDGKRDWQIPIKKHAFAWQGEEKLETFAGRKLPFEIRVKKFYPKSEMTESVEKADSGPSALKVTLYNSFVRQTHWLVQDQPGFKEVTLGPAKVKFENQLVEAEPWLATPETPYLEFRFKDKTVFIPVEGNATHKLKGTPYEIQILKIFKNAAVMGVELIENEDKGQNPAVQLVLKGKDLEERHTIFSNFPEFPTVHGMKPSDSGVKIFYRMPQKGSRGESHELRFVSNVGAGSPRPGAETAPLHYQIIEGPKIRTDKVKIGEDTLTGWMDLRFNVEAFYPHAQIKRNFANISPSSKNETYVPAILIEVRRGDRPVAPTEDQGLKKEIWLRENLGETLEWGKDRFHILLTQKRMPLGFRVELDDFKMEHYPGTESPASFESDVTLKDDGRAFRKDATVSMNQPLIYRGWRIYQSGYSLPEGAPEISVFAVARDPGIPLKYAGAIVMVAGISIMFYTTKYSLNAGRIG